MTIQWQSNDNPIKIKAMTLLTASTTTLNDDAQGLTRCSGRETAIAT
jgi:hypothetical protein